MDSAAKVVETACPYCGGPASEEQYWSVLPDDLGTRVLKRIIRCATRSPRRRFSQGMRTAMCPVWSEELRRELTQGKKDWVECDSGETESVEVEIVTGHSVEIREIHKGRLSSDERQQIVELSLQGLSCEEIASSVGRSLKLVQKLLTEQTQELPPPTARPAQGGELDRVVDFLAELPDEAQEEVVKLARLQRESQALRRELEQRLRRS